MAAKRQKKQSDDECAKAGLDEELRHARGQVDYLLRRLLLDLSLRSEELHKAVTQYLRLKLQLSEPDKVFEAGGRTVRKVVFPFGSELYIVNKLRYLIEHELNGLIFNFKEKIQALDSSFKG